MYCNISNKFTDNICVNWRIYCGIREKNLIVKQYDNIVTSYWFWADQFLMANQVDNGKLWMINNFINIKYNSDWFPQGVYFANNEYRNKMVEFYDCPFLKTQKILYDYKKMIFGKNVVDFSLECIEKNRFVLLLVDRHYLARGKIGNIHQILLHGYDKINKKFYYADNDDNGKYVTDLICSFDQLQAGLLNVEYCSPEPDVSESVFTFDIVQNENYSVNVEKILLQLTQYLYEEKISFDGLYYNGIGVYHALLQYFENELTFPGNFSDLCVIREHKSLMVERIKYLENFCKKKFQTLYMYKSLEHQCEILLMKCIKYYYKRSQEERNDIISMIKNICGEEKKVLSKLICEIRLNFFS